MTVPTAVVPPLTLTSKSVQQLRDELHNSLCKRLLNVPQPPRTEDLGTDENTRIAVLFSGGLDCTVLARMAHDILPPGQGIDLLNVAFENPRVAAIRAKEKAANGDRGTDDIYEACPDRITGRKSFAELAGACPGRVWRFVAVCHCFQSKKPEMSGLTCLTRLTFHTLRTLRTDDRSSLSCIRTTPRWTFP